jgi:hypothetical protein
MCNLFSLQRNVWQVRHWVLLNEYFQRCGSSVIKTAVAASAKCGFGVI